MAYGHAEGIARILARESAAAADAARTTRTTGPPVDRRLYEDPEVRGILAVRDIGGLYRALSAVGVPQRRIAELTGQSQSEVSEIIKGRQVLAYDVLVRIAEGLGVPRGRMGLSYGESGAYAEGTTVASLEEVIEMLRRHVMALAPIAALAHNPLVRLAELLERSALPGPSPVPLPARLSGAHVVQVRELARRLDEAAFTTGSDPAVSSAAAGEASRLLDVPGSEPVKQALTSAVAQLHVHAGWAGFDSGLCDRALHHYARALEMATEASDAYCQTLALNYAGLANIEHGDPDEGLKMLQFAGVTALDIPSDLDPSTVVIGQRSRAALQACGATDSATAYHRLDHPKAADTHLAEARELWQPTRTDPSGDLDRPAASLELERGRLDAAERFAVASMRRWENGGQVSRTQSAIVLAAIHVRAGEPRGLTLANSAIAAADGLTSVRARKRLEPLLKALASRPGADYRDLARRAYHVSTTRV